jgi:hypothetical protein
VKGGEIVNNYSIPVKFEQIANVLDDRFMKVKIWIAHTGENRNRSIFSREVLESMIPSLANIPILGYIATNEDGEEDFKGHEERLVVEDNQFKIKYFGRAYGMIPAENNARFEYRYGEDGVEREYLVVDGVIWRKFPEVEEIFDRDSGYKSQSMELQHSSVKGYTNDEGLFVFTQAKFEGACLLGEDVTPAMVSSTIEKFSVADKIQTDLSEMLKEFNAHFSATKEKGDETVPTNENLEPVVEPTEPVVEPTTEFTEPTVEPTEPTVEPAEPTVEPTTDFTEPTEPVTEPVVEPTTEPTTDFTEPTEPVVEPTEPVVEPVVEKFTRTFELSHDDIRYGLYNAIESHDNFKDSWVWISQVFDNHAIVEDESNGKFFKMNYVKHESAVELGEFEEIFPMWVNTAEKSALEMARNNFEAITEEVKSLREFKATVELTEKEQKLAQYSASLTKEEYETLKGSLSKFSMEDIEKEIGFMLLKKNHFSAKTEETPSRVSATPMEDSNPYGSLATYFTK